MDQEEWNKWMNWYKESIREWKEKYRRAFEQWRERLADWRIETGSGEDPKSAPPLPPLPPLPPRQSLSTSRSNVVASRIFDEELELIDMLIEAGLFGTRSEAVAYLVGEGVKARQDVFTKVSAALTEIRDIRKKAEEQIEKLKREVGLADSEKEKEANKTRSDCGACGKDLSELPGNILLCPFCGTKLGRAES